MRRLLYDHVLFNDDKTAEVCSAANVEVTTHALDVSKLKYVRMSLVWIVETKFKSIQS